MEVVGYVINLFLLLFLSCVATPAKISVQSKIDSIIAADAQQHCGEADFCFLSNFTLVEHEHNASENSSHQLSLAAQIAGIFCRWVEKLLLWMKKVLK